MIDDDDVENVCGGRTRATICDDDDDVKLFERTTTTTSLRWLRLCDVFAAGFSNVRALIYFCARTAYL